MGISRELTRLQSLGEELIKHSVKLPTRRTSFSQRVAIIMHGTDVRNDLCDGVIGFLID